MLKTYVFSYALGAECIPYQTLAEKEDCQAGCPAERPSWPFHPYQPGGKAGQSPDKPA